MQSKVILTISAEDKVDPTTILPRRLDELETLALYFRPELQEERYRKRISLNEVNKARMRLLPGFEMNYGGFYDSNSFLVNNTWTQMSLSLTWNLIKVVANYKNLQFSKQQTWLADARRVALAMAVVTQVDIAKMTYDYAKENLAATDGVLSSEKFIFTTTKQEKQSFENQFNLAKAHGAYILAQLRRDLAYADYQSAKADLLDSIGLDPLLNEQQLSLPIERLSEEVAYSRKRLNQQKHLIDETLLKMRQLNPSKG